MERLWSKHCPGRTEGRSSIKMLLSASTVCLVCVNMSKLQLVTVFDAFQGYANWKNCLPAGVQITAQLSGFLHSEYIFDRRYFPSGVVSI